MVYLEATLVLLQQLNGQQYVISLIQTGTLKEVNGIKYLIAP